MDIFYNINFLLSSIFLRPRIAAHILPLSATLALSYIRKVCACRARSGKDKLCTTLRGRKSFYFMVAPLRILYAQDSEQPLEIRKITPLSTLAFARHDEIPTLPKCRKRKAKCRVRSIPTKRNGVYSTSE